MPGLLPAHLLFKLFAAETSVMLTDLHLLRFCLSAPLWEVCAQSPFSTSKYYVQPQPAGKTDLLGSVSSRYSSV